MTERNMNGERTADKCVQEVGVDISHRKEILVLPAKLAAGAHSSLDDYGRAQHHRSEQQTNTHVFVFRKAL